jgi:hypothetical protein
LEQPQGEAQVAIHPGPDRHRPAWVIEALLPVPLKGVGITFMAVAGQAGGHTVLGHAEATTAAWQDMINGFRGPTAVNTALIGVFMQGLSPASDTELWAEILKENPVPRVHLQASIDSSLPTITGLSMCRRLHFSALAPARCFLAVSH